MAAPLPPPRFLWLRGLVFHVVGWLLTIVCWAVATLLLVLQPRRGRWAASVGRVWAQGMLLVACARLEIEGEQHLAPGDVRVYVANHCSFLDPPALIAAIPANLRFIMKRELVRVPFVGWYTKLAGHFFLDRDRPREGHALLDKAVVRARRFGLSPVIFPEGTRSVDGTLQRLKAGSFQLPVQGGFPVHPVAVLGSQAILPKGTHVPLRCGTITVRIGEAIPTTGYEGSAGRKELAARVRQALLELGVPDGAPAVEGAPSRS